MYRVELARLEAPRGLFDSEPPRRPIELEPLLRNVSAGDIVQLGDGVYIGGASVPDGVTVRGLGAGRTVIDGAGAPAVTLGRSARLEHVHVRGGPRDHRDAGSAVDVVGAAATVLGCSVDGRIGVRADDVRLRATKATAIRSHGVDRLSISRCELRDDRHGLRYADGIHVDGGSRHDIDSCDVHGHDHAIRVTDTTGTVVRGNNISARSCGVHLERTEDAHVHGNFVNHTMRGIDIDAGTHAVVDGNAVCDGDSGCIVEWGAAGCRVSGNRWERCRIGVLAWETTDLHLSGNEAIDLHEPDAAARFGP